MVARITERLRELFEGTLESDLRYDGEVDNINFYDLFCKAASTDHLYKIMGNNVCMYNLKTKGGRDAVLMIFSIPINTPEESGSKNIAERVMEVVNETEDAFTTLDYIKSIEVKEDKFVYVVVIKKLNGG